MTQHCNTCGQDKSLQAFPAHRPKQCKACRFKVKRNWRSKNPERYKAIEAKSRKRRARTPVSKDKVRQYAESYYARNRFKVALKRSAVVALKHGYAPCSASLEEITAAFTGICHNPGCRIPEAECTRRLVLDHCHVTGKFRGWLCGACNRAAGLLAESPRRINGLAEYVEAAVAANKTP